MMNTTKSMNAAQTNNAKVLVIRGRDRLYAGWMPATVGLMTENGRIVRMTPKGFVTLDDKGREQTWLKHTSGWPCAIESQAKRQGWPAVAGRYVPPVED